MGPLMTVDWIPPDLKLISQVSINISLSIAVENVDGNSKTLQSTGGTEPYQRHQTRNILKSVLVKNLHFLFMTAMRSVNLVDGNTSNLQRLICNILKVHLKFSWRLDGNS